MKRTAFLSRWRWLLAVVAMLALAPQTARAAAITGDITFGEAKIHVENAETNWVGGDLLLVYTNASKRTGSFKLPGLAQARILAVGGGGAGGCAAKSPTSDLGGGGGGGAGGFFTNDYLLATNTYSVTVGQGGQNPTSVDVVTPGVSGGSTLITTNGQTFIEAFGGGGGGAQSNGGNGASGGGGSVNFARPKYTEGTGGKGKEGQGHDGGSAPAAKISGRFAAGGGGAGAQAADVSTSANCGGDGLLCDITGQPIYYCGGGAGGRNVALSAGETYDNAGGLGGGGAGGIYKSLKPGKGADGFGGGGGGSGVDLNNVGGNGGCGGVYVRISFALAGPIVPPKGQELTYDGEEHVFVENTPVYTITAGTGVGKNVGTNTATIKLTDTTKYRWEDGGDPTGMRVVTQIIHQAQCEIKNLQQKGWKTGTPAEDTPDPTFEVADYLHAEDEPVIEYCGDGESSYMKEKPTAPGAYFVRATVKDDPKGNYFGDQKFAKFSIYDDPVDVFTDYVEITVAGYASGELIDFPYKVTLANDKPVGFLYERAGLSGEELCFTDEAGNLLNYEIGTWNVRGESLLYVKIPKIGSASQKIRLYWKPGGGGSIPVYDPSTVWDNWPDRSKYDKIVQPKATFGDVVKDGRIVNSWKTYPEMDKTEWNVGETPGKLVKSGELAHGAIVSNLVSAITGEPIADWPTTWTGGVYRLSFTTAEPEKYETPEYHIDLRVVEHIPWGELQGDAPTLTLSGRVLLVNDDYDGKTPSDADPHAVTDQGYWQLQSVEIARNRFQSFNPFWVHEGTRTSYTALPNLREGVDHLLCQTNVVDGIVRTNVIWRLNDVMIGNTTPTAATDDLLADQCYLPWSSTSKMISAYGKRTNAATRPEVGQLVMRNIAGAAIYSPCYSNGIGTVYFDAVNGWRDKFYNKSTSDAEYYHIVVEYADETCDGLPPTDENAYGEDALGNVTAMGRIRPENWKRVAMLPLKRDNGASVFTALDKTNELALAVVNGKTENNFYRICAQVDCRKPSRFRIRRASNYAGGLPDRNALILVDNVIASYPQNVAEVTSYGVYDKARTGKRVLGQENAMTTPFPSIADDGIFARTLTNVWANASTNVDPMTFLQLSRMHYRWRYLEQVVGDWKTIDLLPINGFVAEKPLEVPQSVGDVEYWFETFTQMPYYQYHDYSGKGYGLKGASGDLYSEEKAIVTNRMDLALADGALPSLGTDWFFRLRYGQSDWQAVKVLVKRGENAEPEEYEMELTGNHNWRGYFRTPDPGETDLLVRFEALNRQTPGSETLATNRTLYALRNDVDTLPTAATLVDGSSNTWTHVRFTATTGFLLFQIEDETRGVSIVRADYQDFNSWSDANKVGHPFVGTSTDLSSKHASGSNPEVKTYEETMQAWQLSMSTNLLWSESFPATATEMAPGGAWEVFKPFTEPRPSPNTAFTVGPGQWVTGNYRDTGTGMALQMQGQGKGYIQYVNESSFSPRGIEAVKFNARLAQSIQFNDFCYYDGGSKTAMTNYTFTTRAAYDINSRQNFAGNASLSVVAFYQPGVGCYELRVEQEDAKFEAGTTKVSGPGNKQRLTLYRWRYDATTGGMVATSLGTCVSAKTTSSTLTTSGESDTYGAIFIDVQSTAKKNGVTYVRAGITISKATAGNEVSGDSVWVWYNDTDEKSRLTCGSYGVLSANCEGRFVSPYVYVNGHSSSTPAKTTDVGFKSKDGGTSFTKPGVGMRTCYDELIKNEEWAEKPWRMKHYEETPARYGLKSDPSTQTLNIYTAPAGTTAWTLQATTNITSFGSKTQLAQPVVVNLWSRDDCAVRIAPGGDDSTARNDVVIDDLEICQWRGEGYYEGDRRTEFPDTAHASPTNFVFTQGWIQKGAYDLVNCQLSAKRSRLETPTSIRSPLMDGESGRGLGLGMFTFTYTNAQPNVKLLLQVATNRVDYSSFDNISRSLSGNDWTTVTNYDFKTMPVGGTCSYYFGLHAVKGAMRIVMDPEVVAAVEGETDPEKFGTIDITGVLCRDEPALDAFSWWGWNLRTTGEEGFLNICDAAARPVENGMSLGLNNSITADILKVDEAEYPKHLPFVQTPTFPAEVVGEVCFKARKYGVSDPTARITLYGAHTGLVEDDAKWEKLTSWDVTNATFQAYTFKTRPGDNYCAFRFAVTGVDDVISPMPDPTPLKPPQRVLIDEVLVMERMDPQVGFRNVAAFRSFLDSRVLVTNALDSSALEDRKREQPLCGESWGVQAEIFASQLADEVDLSSAKVRLWWYEGTSPWGFKNWRDRSGAKNAWLSACDGTNLVFRSSLFGSPDAVMPVQNKPNTTVQYMLEVVYRTTKGVLASNQLARAEWTNPEWYYPVDYNAAAGGGSRDFSAYTILDTVSPGWAWINEENVFGQYYSGWNNSDRPLQFIEVAAPEYADLTGWKLRFLDAQIGDRVVTNVMATFGTDLPGEKHTGMHLDSECVFHVVGSPAATSSLKDVIDGTWKAVSTDSKALKSDGEIYSYHPVSVQLVRPSGIVEHEITAIGTNYYATSESRNPEKHVEYLNANGGRFIYIGHDDTGSDSGTIDMWSHSLGVVADKGGSPMQWNNFNTMTPGAVNGGQTMPTGLVKPNGSSIIIYASIEGLHLNQTFGGYENTTDTVALAYTKWDGGADVPATNITYHTDQWYELGSVTVNGEPAEWSTAGNRTFTVAVGHNAKADVKVVAKAAVKSDVDRLIGPNNRYRDGIVNWLERGETKRGAFANSDRDTVGRARFESWNGSFITNLSLTAMYWLDMDPTLEQDQLILRGGITGFVLDVPQVISPTLTRHNRRITLSMMITNTVTDEAWAPYILRSDVPDVTSWEYASTMSWQWTNESFKVTGILFNGEDLSKLKLIERDNWIPLRWFVFNGGKTGDTVYSSSFDENFSSVIDIIDPHSSASPGYAYDWWKYKGIYPVWHSWDIDDRIRPITVEVMKPKNQYTED